ncbi:MAG TPA: winged helix-turn-helix domain-containing protein [Solirubrobacterales bacterium]
MAAKGKTKSATAKRGKKKETGVDQKLVKALAHPLRVEILTILNERMASPNELSKELDEGLSQVSYHVKVLKDFECIEMVKTEPRRGAVEHYYRATARAFLTDKDWKSLPDSVKPGVSASSIRMIIENVFGALKVGTFDSREDRHISWTPGYVDEQGWEELVDLINDTLSKIIKIHAGSAKRLAKSGETGIPVNVVLLNYETPPAAKKAKAKAKAKAKSKAKAKKASRKA